MEVFVAKTSGINLYRFQTLFSFVLNNGNRYKSCFKKSIHKVNCFSSIHYVAIVAQVGHVCGPRPGLPNRR